MTAKTSNQDATAEDIAARIARTKAPAWLPTPGDILYGPEVAGIRIGEGPYGRYPILILKIQDGSYVAIHAFHTLFIQAIAELKPTPGFKFDAIQYLGLRETNKSRKDESLDDRDRTYYHDYAILSAQTDSPDDPMAGIDWDEFDK
jgi:hypothetical protein